MTSNYAERRYYTNFNGPYFHIATGLRHMVGYAGSTACTVHADVTLTLIQGQGQGG